MPNTELKPIVHSAAWKTSELATRTDLTVDLGERQLDAFHDALQQALATGKPLGELRPGDFPLASIAHDIKDWKHRLSHGAGMVWFRGFPIDRYSIEEWEKLYLGMGLHLGQPVSQSNLGDLVGHVVNIGDKDRRERAYRNNRKLDLHTDRCDYIGMFCLQKAKSGGVSGYASALAVHNEIHRTRPELLEPLYEGFRLHRFGEQPEGEPPITEQKIPIFSISDSYPNVIYIRGYIDLAVQEGFYALAENEQAALDYFDELAASEEFCFNATIEPGEAVFTNNCLLLHKRTAFEDYDEPQRRRYLMRLWLSDPDRPASVGVRAHKTSRGIEKRQDRGTYYSGPGYANPSVDDGY